MADAHKNFAYSTVLTAPSPAVSGTSLVVQSGDGAHFPTPPFNATVWPAGAQPTIENSEIVRVTAISTDTFTIVRNQEDSVSEPIAVGDQIAATITAQTMYTAENPVASWSPFVLGSGTASALQTQYSNYTNTSGVGSLLVFPVTVPAKLQFNEIMIANSLAYTTVAANALSAAYVSKFGLYSMNGNSLSLISSNSFYIKESLNAASLTWEFPTSTATTGYAYGSFPAGNLTAIAQINSFVTGNRLFGLQFNANMRLNAGIYWLGLLGYRSSVGTNSTFGLSLGGLIGQVINTVNQFANTSGFMPFGYAGSVFSTNLTHSTNMWGRHFAGFVTATSLTDFLGTAIPDVISFSALRATNAASSVTVLPAITFVST